MVITQELYKLTVGSDGTASLQKTLRGKIHKVSYNHPGNNYNLLVQLNAPEGENITVLNLPGIGSAGNRRPRVPVHYTVGATVTYDGTNEIYDYMAAHDPVTVSVAAGTEDDVVLVHVTLEN